MNKNYLNDKIIDILKDIAYDISNQIIRNNIFQLEKIIKNEDKPNGCCSQCGAPLNEYMVGGYKMHDGEFSVAVASNRHGWPEIQKHYDLMQKRKDELKNG
jgi:hypothetical protein